MKTEQQSASLYFGRERLGRYERREGSKSFEAFGGQGDDALGSFGCREEALDAIRKAAENRGVTDKRGGVLTPQLSVTGDPS